MYRLERDEIHENLNRWGRDASVDSEVYLFGVNDYAREIICYLSSKGFQIKAILDNDKRKQGSYCQGIPVVSPKEKGSNGCFIICTAFWREMKAQLLDEGITEEHIFCIALSTFSESFGGNVRDLFRGRRIYREICRKYPDTKILLCPYTGTGDVYLIGTFLKAYLE